ncbi:MAG: M20/M25/M40 family metallo-hydrolase [Planctomycetaceae bacterium]|nr:M20/M25/M40 family metallo-hydrolase [Planctomycetaceae bacterium]
MTTNTTQVRFSAWPLLFAIFLATLFATLGYVRYAPPPLPQASEPQAEFLERVLKTLEMLVGDDIPHPSGTPQNAVVRQRIIQFVEGLGQHVELQETSGVAWQTKQTVPLVNLLVLIPGTDPIATIALTSHYDSTAAGPGAADDGAAVAISLELLREYQQHPPKNNLLFLITDGEELGLLGAEKFVNEHPLAKTIDLVINLEARGTSGPSCMFETGEASRWTIEQYRESALRPTTSSLFFEVYKLLPNNTDFTHYRKLPIQGWNFAFVGNVLDYHTPQDNFANVDRRSIYHHAVHASALMAKFANAKELKIESGRSVYFDYLSLGVLAWPEEFTVYLACVPTIMILASFMIAWRAHRLTLIRISLALVWLLGLIISLGVGLWLTFETMKFQDIFSPPWPKYPVPILLAFWVIALGISIAFARIGFRLVHEAYNLLALIGVALTWLTATYVPGASYLFLLPTIGWGTAAWFSGRWPAYMAVMSWLAVVALWFPLEPLFYDALGFRAREILLGRLLLLNVTLSPVCLVSWVANGEAPDEARKLAKET